jgi:hypothetical protein
VALPLPDAELHALSLAEPLTLALGDPESLPPRSALPLTLGLLLALTGDTEAQTDALARAVALPLSPPRPRTAPRPPVALTVPLRVGARTEGDAVLLRVGVAVGVSVMEAEPLAVAEGREEGEPLVDAEGVGLPVARDVEEGEPEEVAEGDAVRVRVEVEVAVIVAVAVSVAGPATSRRSPAAAPAGGGGPLPGRAADTPPGCGNSAAATAGADTHKSGNAIRKNK